jgi:hypothetical protein
VGIYSQELATDPHPQTFKIRQKCQINFNIILSSMSTLRSNFFPSGFLTSCLHVFKQRLRFGNSLIPNGLIIPETAQQKYQVSHRGVGRGDGWTGGCGSHASRGQSLLFPLQHSGWAGGARSITVVIVQHSLPWYLLVFQHSQKVEVIVITELEMTSAFSIYLQPTTSFLTVYCFKSNSTERCVLQ